MTGKRDPAPAGPPLPAPGWVSALAEMLRAVETERFPTALRKVLELVCPFESMLVSAYEGNATPRALYHDLDEMTAAISVEFYSGGPYLLDPFYQACRNNVAPGAYRLLDLAPKAFLRSDYYRTFYRKVRIHDEMAILLRGGADRWIAISLARTQRRRRYDSAERDRLNHVLPLIESAALRTWASGRPDGDRADQAPEERLSGFARDLLSPREAEIIQLILQGHSTPTIATHLGIAEGTVKVHRHHAYSKLGIHSQSELFSLLTRYLLDSRS